MIILIAVIWFDLLKILTVRGVLYRAWGQAEMVF